MSDTGYMRAADGKFYEEVQRPDGGFDYLPADPKLTFREVGREGRYVAVRDQEEANRQRALDSHLDHFFDPDTKKAKQRLKRVDALEKQMAQLVIDRVTPGASPQVRTVSDNEYQSLRIQYADAVGKGEQRRCDYQPLSAYHKKLITSSGAIVRPLLKGEVGMLGSTILILEPGYGSGNSVTVTEDLE